MDQQRTLVVYHSVDGQAERIANRIGEHLSRSGIAVDVSPVASAPDPAGYDGVVVGDSIHTGHHSKELTRYVQDNAKVMNQMPSALFQVSLTSANPDEEHRATAMGLAAELLDATGFEPGDVGLFAGKLAYTKYGWLKRRIVRHIVKAEGGDTDMSRDWEYTDWDAVYRFADTFRAQVSAVRHASG